MSFNFSQTGEVGGTTVSPQSGVEASGQDLAGPTLSFSGHRESHELTQRLNSIIKSAPMDISKVEDGGRYDGIAYVKNAIARASNKSAVDEDVELILVDTKGNQFQATLYNPANIEDILNTKSKTVQVEGTAKEFKGKLYYRVNNLFLYDEQLPLSYFLKTASSSKVAEHKELIVKALTQSPTHYMILESIGVMDYIRYLETIPLKGAIGNVIIAMSNAIQISNIASGNLNTTIPKTGSDVIAAQTIQFLIIARYIRDFKYGEYTERNVLPLEVHRAIMESDLDNNKKASLIESLSGTRTSDRDLTEKIWSISVGMI